MTVKRWIFIVILFFGLAACEPSPGRSDLSEDSVGQSQTWIDAPLPNSTIPKLPYKLIFHGASPGGITEFEIHINSVLNTKVPPVSADPNGTLFFGEYLWTPVAPGTFLIEVRGIGSGGVSSSDQVYVTVVGDEDEDEEVTPASTPRLTPVSDPTATSRSTATPTATSRSTATSTATSRSTATPTATSPPPIATNTPIPEVGQIKVHVFMDGNENGSQDRSENNYPNVLVNLSNCSCSNRCAVSDNATTNNDGNVLFSNLPYGPYCVTTDSRLTPTTTYPVNVNVNSPSIVAVTIGYK